MKIIDCFTFYNELDLLTYRLNILNDLVDYFVIVEATRTYMGNEKELFYLKNKNLYEKFKDKIIHVIVDDIPFAKPNINRGYLWNSGEQWENEVFQRNCISRGIRLIDDKLNNEDLIMIADLDEIPDPEVLKKVKNNEITFENTIKLSMDMYYYNLNTKFVDQWHRLILVKYDYYKNARMTCDDFKMSDPQRIPNAGWHLSYFYDADYISNKIKNFSHQELNNENFTNVNKIKDRINNFSDLFDRGFKYEKIPLDENKYLPPDVKLYLSKFILI